MIAALSLNVQVTFSLPLPLCFLKPHIDTVFHTSRSDTKVENLFSPYRTWREGVCQKGINKTLKFSFQMKEIVMFVMITDRKSHPHRKWEKKLTKTDNARSWTPDNLQNLFHDNLQHATLSCQLHVSSHFQPINLITGQLHSQNAHPAWNTKYSARQKRTKT